MTTTMNPRLLAEDTLRNVEAFGGSTLSFIAGVPTASSGYAVSLPGHETTTGARHLAKGEWQSTTLPNFVEYYIEKHRAVLAQPGRYLGAWLDGDTLYLDVSEIHSELATAARLGWERNQLAIYDVARGQDIRTRPGRRTLVTDAQTTADRLAHENGWVRDWFVRLGTVHGDIMASVTTPADPSPFTVESSAIAELGEDGELRLVPDFGKALDVVGGPAAEDEYQARRSG